MVNAAQTADFKHALGREARRLGFAAWGVAPAAEDPLVAARLAQWLDQGNHGTMTWMAERAAHRRSPQGLWPEANSVIALGMSYAAAYRPNPADRGQISVYAQGRDYHDVVKSALKALARWLVAEAERRGLGEAGVKVFVDTAPVPEKPLAAAAGLGWQGKHTNLVSRTEGSWMFLSAIYTTLDLTPDEPAQDRCGSCTACQSSCPTAAFPAPYQLDARRCISYLTIELKGPIPQEFRKAIGNRIYGCDDCLAVCPWNKFASEARRVQAFLPRAELVSPRLADLLALDDAAFRKLFAGSPIKRIGRNRFVRNCLIAAGNSRDAGLIRQVRALTLDPDEVVAEAARWALEELQRLPSGGPQWVETAPT